MGPIEFADGNGIGGIVVLVEIRVSISTLW